MLLIMWLDRVPAGRPALYCFIGTYEGVTIPHGLRCPPFSDNYGTKTAEKEGPAPLRSPHPFTGHNDKLDCYPGYKDTHLFRFAQISLTRLIHLPRIALSILPFVFNRNNVANKAIHINPILAEFLGHPFHLRVHRKGDVHAQFRSFARSATTWAAASVIIVSIHIHPGIRYPWDTRVYCQILSIFYTWSLGCIP